MEILSKNQKKMLEIKNTARKMKSVFDAFISRLDRISDTENISIKPPNLKTKIEQNMTEYSSIVV